MALLRIALACALGVLLLTPQAAAGGGWASWIDVSRTTVAPGQQVEVNAEAWFRSPEAARAAGPFYVYLLRDFDYSIVERAWGKPAPGDWWSLGGAEAIEVGQVTVSLPNSNVGRARAEFTVPELPPATYHLMLCDAGCTKPLGTVIPSKGFTVVADAATAQLAQRVEALGRRIRAQAGELKAADAKADRALDQARGAGGAVDRLDARVSSLEDQDEASTAPWAYAGGLIAAALAGALVLRIVRRRRPPLLGADNFGEAHVSDEELRELISSEAHHSR
jgi:hypothetical protein